jgi:NADH:ubiquinone oxidoreductase subunit E
MDGDITDSGFFGTEGGDGAENLDPAVIDLIDELLAQAGPGREGLIRVLLGFQQTFDRVSWRVQELVADRFGLSPAQIAGVVSYYPKLSAQRRGRLKVDVCSGTGCFLRGGERILRQVARDAASQTSTTDEPRLAVQQERCVGVCGLGPVVRIHNRVRTMEEQSETDELVESLLGPGPHGEDDR